MRNKENDTNFINNIQNYDIIALLETWTHKHEDLSPIEMLLPDYKMYVQHGTKRSKHGRASGGVLVFIKTGLAEHITPIKCNYKFGLAFLMTEVISIKSFILLFTYLPPYGSTSYPNDEINGIQHLENLLVHLDNKYPGIDKIISGDLNARTKDLPDYILDDNVDHIPVPEFYTADSFSTPRQSRDSHGEINKHGESLLRLCSTHGIHMLNGRMNGDSAGQLTCFTANGSSLIDYTLVSTSLFPLVERFEIGNADDFTHLPQTFRILSLDINTFKNTQSDELKHSQFKKMRYKWTASSYESMLVSHHLVDFNSCIDNGDINNALSSFNSLLRDSCAITNRNCRKIQKSNAEWWDKEMDCLKHQKYKCLRVLRITPSETALLTYRNIRKLYKSKIKEKKYSLMNRNREIVEQCKSASEFWKFVKARSQRRNCLNNIAHSDWKAYFDELLNTKNVINAEFENVVNCYMSWHDENCEECASDAVNINDNLNKDFSIREIEIALQELHNGKAEGLDGISNEILKNASVIVVPILCKLFNKILECKTFPDEWGKAIIVPIHKKGSFNEPNNYRGIALLSCVSKLFTKIINNRLTVWAEENNKMYDVQGGFTKGKGSIDNIFIFQSLISKYLTKAKGRFYSVFIDFSKAFDSVPHLQLFYSLVQEGLHGRVLSVLRNMYTKLLSCVQASNGDVSEFFTCSIGTRQGCMISPFLFIFYLNEFIKQTILNECKGVYIDESHANVTMLLYADDIVLVGDNIGHMQHLLDNLYAYCNTWGLTVNMDKTKFMIFRNGGIIKRNERLYYNGESITSVSYYKYLGLIMSTRLSWSPAQQTLSLQAEKAMYCINKLNSECNFSFPTSSNIFNKCIIPIALYGSEIWGAKVHNTIESVLLKFCRQQLGVSSKSASPALLGECGRHSMYVYCYIRCIKYWLKLLNLPDGHLLRSCYNMLLKHSNAGRINWASDIRNLLYRLGFGNIWEAQNVEDVRCFLKEFSLRVYDCNIQSWKGNMTSLLKLRTLNLFKQDLIVEPYLLLRIPQRIRSCLAKFRIGTHSLEIEQGRHRKIPSEKRLCKLCLNLQEHFLEDEYHVLIQCPFYKTLRDIYLDFVQTPPNLFTFVQIMSTKSEIELCRLGSFVAAMFKLREILLLSL